VIRVSSTIAELESKRNQFSQIPDWKVHFYRFLMNLRLRIQFSLKESIPETESLIFRMKKPSLVIASNSLRHHYIKIETFEERDLVSLPNLKFQQSSQTSSQPQQTTTHSSQLSSSQNPQNILELLEQIQEKDNSPSISTNETNNSNISKNNEVTFWNSLHRAPNCHILSNGDILYTLETIVGMLHKFYSFLFHLQRKLIVLLC
jgi:hypothetical protein